MKTRLPLFFLLLISLMVFGGCHHSAQIIQAPDLEDPDAPLNPGEWGLEKLDPKDYPDMKAAFMDRDNLEKAIDKSIQWLGTKSSREVYAGTGPYAGKQTGVGPITHDQVLATLQDVKGMLHTAKSPEEFQQALLTRYDVYTSKGYNRKGDVWFTGYYTPIFHASRTRTGEYQYPIYSRPADLISDPTGEINGQRAADGTLHPYPTRREIVTNNLMAGKELLWFKDKFEPYIVQVQGSAKVILPDNSSILVGYAGKNGRDYHGVGAELVKDGKIAKKQLSLPAVMAYFKEHPQEVDEYIMRNDSFAFLKEYAATEWPSGSMGVQVTSQRSLATDKTIFPRAALTFIACEKPDTAGEVKPYTGFLLDQDTGGGIRTAGRADIYMGVGDAAGEQAGREFSKGRLYYLFLKPGQYQEHPNLTRTTPPSGHPKHGGGTTPAVPPASDSDIFPGAHPVK
jgi:membrane-bound lytic murein transglycosylase A